MANSKSKNKKKSSQEDKTSTSSKNPNTTKESKDINKDDYYLVEKILSHRSASGSCLGVKQVDAADYQVKWHGYEETSWEPASKIKSDAPQSVADYWKLQGEYDSENDEDFIPSEEPDSDGHLSGQTESPNLDEELSEEIDSEDERERRREQRRKDREFLDDDEPKRKKKKIKKSQSDSTSEEEFVPEDEDDEPKPKKKKLQNSQLNSSSEDENSVGDKENLDPEEEDDDEEDRRSNCSADEINERIENCKHNKNRKFNKRFFKLICNDKKCVWYGLQHRHCFLCGKAAGEWKICRRLEKLLAKGKDVKKLLHESNKIGMRLAEELG